MAVVLNLKTVEEELDVENSNYILHSEGFKAIKVALEYISQQKRPTAADICLQKWKDISVWKRTERKANDYHRLLYTVIF